MRFIFSEPSSKQRGAIYESLGRIVLHIQEKIASEVIAAENIHHFIHGSRWSHPANDFTTESTMTGRTAEHSLSFKQIVDGDLSQISEGIDSIANQMKAEFFRSIYEVVEEACDRSGNIVSEQNLAVGIIAALEKIKFSVDRLGNVSPPQLHMHPSMIEKLESLPPEVHSRIQTIVAEKSREALEDEHRRLLRYKRQVE
jgi:hypothetical protein